jgi:Protein of unknown function (DUF3616)
MKMPVPVRFLILAFLVPSGTGQSQEAAYAWHFEMCDASAAVAVGTNFFAVANDEDNTLRLYDRDRSGGPVSATPLDAFLKVDQKRPEADLEGAAWLGDRIFWISSHGRNREGKVRESRNRFFATRVKRTGSGYYLEPVGRPCRRLLTDLVHNRELSRFRLLEASTLAPKEPGGLNIEGLCATPEGHLLIGFRNPIPEGQALVVPLLNPFGLLAGQSAQFGAVIRLDLGGLGIRDMIRLGSHYLIIAGSFNDQGGSRLYRWSGGRDRPAPVPDVTFPQFNPEAIVSYPDRPGRLQLLSDDGTRLLNGVECKRVSDPAQRRFRSIWVTLPNAD